MGSLWNSWWDHVAWQPSSLLISSLVNEFRVKEVKSFTPQGPCWLFTVLNRNATNAMLLMIYLHWEESILLLFHGTREQDNTLFYKVVEEYWWQDVSVFFYWLESVNYNCVYMYYFMVGKEGREGSRGGRILMTKTFRTAHLSPVSVQ